MIGPLSYVGGVVAVGVVGGASCWAAVRLRIALLPDWRGPSARLAELVVVIGVPVLVSQVLGSFGQFRRIPVLIGCVGAAITLGAVAGAYVRRREPRMSPGSDETPVVQRASRVTMAACVLASATVAAQWVAHVASAYGRGMTHFDTLWYHGPYAAQFVQTGRLLDLLNRTDPTHTYAAQNSEVVHALFELAFGRDLVSPLLNLGWAALALLAAWCIGRRYGMGSMSVLGCVIVLGLPIIAGTQPGQASNDVAASALLLASVALLLEGRLRPVPTGFAAVAAGLALGTKLTVTAPVAVLTIGILVLAFRARRSVTAVCWCGVLAISGGYWFLRNVIRAHNPVPYYAVHLGPISLPAPGKLSKFFAESVADHLTDGFVWRRYFLPGLAQGLGRAWPLLLVLPVAGAIWVGVRGSVPIERVAGLAVLVGLVAYVFTPITAGSGGLGFVFNLRYASPALLLGFALFPLALARLGSRWREGVSILLLGLVALDATARDSERTTAWPQKYFLVALLVGLAVVTLPVAWRFLRRPVWRSRIAAVGVVAVTAALIGGWWVQRSYLQDRYGRVGLPHDTINRYFRGVRNSTVAVFGTVEIYPMSGLDLSDRVTKMVGSLDPHVNRCQEWQSILAGRYRYVVVTKDLYDPHPPQSWFTNDPAATRVVHQGTDVVYRIDGTLHPAEC
jgi:hypothetical protein